MSCPNINSAEWKSLVARIGFNRAYEEFLKHGGLIPPAANYEYSIKGIDASTKMSKALMHPKAATLFKAFYKSNPDKFYSELMQNAGAPKNQILMLKALNERTQPETIADMITNLLSETAYTVQIEEATEGYADHDRYGVGSMEREDGTVEYMVYDWHGEGESEIAIDTFDNEADAHALVESLGQRKSTTTHYAKLIVPGGVDYKENRIITPTIVPSIKGHAAFAEKNDIGWFRSDDRLYKQSDKNFYQQYVDEKGDSLMYTQYEDVVASEDFQEWVVAKKAAAQAYDASLVKTRRILELQSDLFQKARDLEQIANRSEMAYDVGDEAVDKANSFLQLLNKDNNWVSFFVQSIVQDSMRRGYEKVLFPAGDTAAKIEGHDTLQDYLQARQDRIMYLEEQIANTEVSFEDFKRRVDARGYIEMSTDGESAWGYKFLPEENIWTKFRQRAGHIDGDVPSLQEIYEIKKPELELAAAAKVEKMQTEIAQFTKEIKDAQENNNVFSAIRKFYEVDVQNTLRKRGYNPQLTFDEYGNGWFEVIAKPDFKETIFFNRSVDSNTTKFLESKGLIINRNGDAYVTGDYQNSISDRLTSVQEYNEKYYQLHGFHPFLIDKVADGLYKVTANIVASQLSQPVDNEGTMRLSKLADKLQERFGIEYEVVSTAKAKELLGEAYNNEPAFYYKDKVFMVEGRFTLENTLHEYAHPLMLALHKSNPSLYNNMYKLLENSLDSNALTILADVRRLYPELGENTSQFKDEVMVRAITALAQNKLKQGDFKVFLQRLWYRLKEMLRVAFGNVNLDKLSMNTTIEQLSDMLAFGTNKIDKVEAEFPMFNRALAEDLSKIKESEVSNKIEQFKLILKNHIRFLKGHNYAKLREILKNEQDGSIPQDIASVLRKADKLSDSIEDNFKKLRAFAEAIIGARKIAEKISAHVAELHGTIPERDMLRILSHYNKIVSDWEESFKGLEEVSELEFKELTNEIQIARSHFTKIHKITREVLKGGVLELLNEQLAPVGKSVDDLYKDRIAALEIEAQTKPEVKSKLASLKKEYDKLNLSEEVINDYLEGNRGDTSPFSAFLEAYTNSPDPIVGGFSVFMKKAFLKVESIVNEYSTRLRFNLKDDYKKLSITRRNPEDLGRRLTAIDTLLSKDENGDEIVHEVYVLLNEFHGGWLADYQRLNKKMEAAITKGDKAEIKIARKELEQLKKDYFHREYKDNVYAAWEFWDRDDITREAFEQREVIINKIKVLEATIDIVNKDDSASDVEALEELIKELRQLRSLKNPDGTDKDEKGIAIATALQEHAEISKGLYGEYEIKGLFERELKTLKDDLLDKGFAEDSDEYKERLNKWVRANVRFKLSEQFYSDRKNIIDQIDEIVSKLPNDDNDKLSISDKWKEIFEIIKSNRDEDGQPIGSDLSIEQLNAVRLLQDEIDEIRATLVRLSGITFAEEDFMGEYLAKRAAGFATTTIEDNYFAEISARQEEMGLTQADKNRLSLLFQSLKEFQTKIPTEYYIDQFNAQTRKHNVMFNGQILGISVLSAGSILNVDAMQPILDANPEFAKWFYNNHREKDTYDSFLQTTVRSFERLYVWNRIVPNEPAIINAFDKSAYADLLEMKSPYFEVKKARKFYFYRIKDEHKTGYDESTGRVRLEVGLHKDNRGNWLPRQDVENSPYVNKAYFDLKNSQSEEDKALFRVLETYKSHHLMVQEQAINESKLWYELPRVRKHRVEVMAEAITSPKKFVKDLIYNIKGAIRERKDDFDRNLMKPQDIREESKLYVMTDLFGNERQSIPMKLMSKIDKDYVSLDIYRSIMMYTTAIENNKMLHEINPLARALEATVAEAGIKSVNKVSMYSSVANMFNIPVKEKDNVRLKALRNMFERDIEGIEKKMEIGVFGDKVASHIMGLAAFGSLALNIPAGIKNLFTARIQNVLEGISGVNFDLSDWTKASGQFFTDIVPSIVQDYNTFGDKSINTQLFELFDPVEGKYLETMGKEGTDSYVRDVANLQFTQSPQAFGEINAQGTAWLAMMNRITVKQNLNGVETDVPYFQAWEKNSKGVIQLKPGIDPTWDRTGDSFLSFKTKMHKVNEMLQGAYAPSNQPELSRYTLGKLALFMRRFVAPGLTNRFAPIRRNAALGNVREGYYITTAKVARDLIASKMKNWHIYTPEEKKQVYRTITEIGYSVLFLLLLSLVGFSNGDEDRFKKVKTYDWTRQMIIYELMLIKGEVETFVPGPGFNEMLRMKDNPSIAFPIINKYWKVMNNFYLWASQNEKAYYQKKTGIWDKGDLKLFADLTKIAGFNGNTFNPEVALKNYSMSMNRY